MITYLLTKFNSVSKPKYPASEEEGGGLFLRIQNSSCRVGFGRNFIPNFRRVGKYSNPDPTIHRRFAKLDLLSWTNLQKKGTFCVFFFIFVQKSMGPVLIESSANATMPTYPEYLPTIGLKAPELPG